MTLLELTIMIDKFNRDNEGKMQVTYYVTDLIAKKKQEEERLKAFEEKTKDNITLEQIVQAWPVLAFEKSVSASFLERLESDDKKSGVLLAVDYDPLEGDYNMRLTVLTNSPEALRKRGDVWLYDIDVFRLLEELNIIAMEVAKEQIKDL